MPVAPPTRTERILQAEGTLDINTVFAGMFVLTGCAQEMDNLIEVKICRRSRW